MSQMLPPRPLGGFPSVPAVALLAVGGLTATCAGQAKEHSYVAGIDGKRVFDLNLMKMIKDKLTEYDNLQIVISSCHSGGFADEANARLGGKVSVAVSRSKEKCEGFDRQSENATHRSGRGGPGLQGMPGDDTAYYFGWGAQWIKKMRDTASATAQQIFDAAKTNDYDPDDQRNTPVHVVKNGGEAVTVKLGSDLNEALLWATIDSGPYCQLYRGLRDMGYSDGTQQNARIDAAYDLITGRNIGNRNDVVWVDRKAEGAAMEGMLDGLRARLSNTKKGFIYIGSHGNVAEVKAELSPGGSQGLPLQGRVIDPSGTAVSIALPAPFLEDFFEGVATDNRTIKRMLPASVLLCTAEEHYTGPLAVRIDGLMAGTIFMTGSGLGGEYSVDLPDGLVQSLFSQGLLEDLSADITFEFLSGSGPDRRFRVAMEADFELGGRTVYGVALAGPSVIGVAEMDICYANCDGSTQAPILNVLDFVCFQARFGAGDLYANCDRSLEPPVLSVNDFMCFLNAFAAGCP
jgi:hypothetical protein